jgi:hypothetical protein
MDESLLRDYLRKRPIWRLFLWWTTLYQRNDLTARRPCVVNLHRAGTADSNGPF